MRLIWSAAPAAGIFLFTLASANAQEPRELTAGFSEERSLGPRDSHVYVVHLENGAAVLREADQHLVVVFDGSTYDGGPSSLIPTPTILDNLIAARKIGPTVAIFVNNMGQRSRDLGGYTPFDDFLALELIPWVRANYAIKDGPSHIVLAGSSRGGLAASHCAFFHPEVVGNCFLSRVRFL